MATQTRRTIRRSARFLRATVTASMVAACCGLILWSTVAAHAAAPYNGMPYNGMPYNGMPYNGMPYNGMPYNGMPIQGMPVNGMPFNGMPFQGLLMNGTPINGMPYNGTPLNGLPAHEASLPTVQSEHLPWSTLSQRALGTTPPSRIGFLSPCSRSRLGPLCL
jgi:hypothetical protein